MYSIGDLAQLGGVSPRMLRHYHELGLLVPTKIDDSTGYRRYDASELAELFQILALKGLGFGLADIKRVVRDGVSPAEIRGMLLLRRTQLKSELHETESRLRRVESHIHRLEVQTTPTPPPSAVTTKRLPAVHLAIASAVSASFAPADIGPVIQPLYPRLIDSLRAAGVATAGPSIAFYDDNAAGTINVHAGFPIDESITDVAGLDVVDLPEIALAAVAIHHGDMATVDVDTGTALFDWIRNHGFNTTGYSREHYLLSPDDLSDWQTEIQFPIEPDNVA